MCVLGVGRVCLRVVCVCFEGGACVFYVWCVCTIKMVCVCFEGGVCKCVFAMAWCIF